MPPDPIWSQLLLQVVLIAINAFFAATEIAVISLNENRLRRQADEGDRKAAQMLRMVENSAAFLSTIQVGITLAGFLASAFAADNFADRLVRWLVDVKHFTAIPESTLNTLSVIFITLILSYFTLVLGELVPKQVAMKKSDAGRPDGFRCHPLSLHCPQARGLVSFRFYQGCAPPDGD